MKVSGINAPAGSYPGYTFARDRIYTPWDSATDNSSRLKADKAAGVLANFSLQTHLANGTKVPWTEISAGKFDAHLVDIANRLAPYQDGMQFALQHEPNSVVNIQSSGASGFKAAWSHVRKVMIGAGFRPQAYVCCLTSAGFSTWVPSDVELIAADPYNWAFTDHDPTGKGWRDLSAGAKAMMDYAAKVGKPAAVWETNCMEDPNDPMRKAKWIASAAAWGKSVGLQALTFFNGDPTHGWNLLSSAPARSAVAALLADPYYA